MREGGDGERGGGGGKRWEEGRGCWEYQSQIHHQSREVLFPTAVTTKTSVVYGKRFKSAIRTAVRK